MKNIFLKKSYRKCGGETSPRPFSEKPKLSISASTVWISVQFVLLHLQVDDYHTALKLSCWPYAFTFCKGLLKNKKWSGTSLPASCYAWFLQKNICVAIFYYLTKFHCLVVSTPWDIRKYMYCNCLLTRLWRHEFWNSSHLIFLIKPFFQHNQKVTTKT